MLTVLLRSQTLSVIRRGGKVFAGTANSFYSEVRYFPHHMKWHAKSIKDVVQVLAGALNKQFFKLTFYVTPLATITLSILSYVLLMFKENAQFPASELRLMP